MSKTINEEIENLIAQNKEIDNITIFPFEWYAVILFLAIVFLALIGAISIGSIIIAMGMGGMGFTCGIRFVAQHFERVKDGDKNDG
jgi:hypothetical protein